MTSVVERDRSTAIRSRAATMRRDAWWIEPLLTALVLLGFVVYATWAAFVGYELLRRPVPVALLLAVHRVELSRPDGDRGG